MNNNNLQIQEIQRTSSRINSLKNVPGHIIIKPLKTKDKEKTLKTFRGEGHNKDTTIRVMIDLKSETMDARMK